MAKYCLNCGAELVQGSKFCTSCGSIFEENPVQSMPAGNISQQQPPIYTPMQQSLPHKSKNKLIFAVVAVVVVAIVVVVALFLIMQGNTANDAKKFVGTWNVSMSYGGTSSPTGTWTFYENGSLKMAYASSNNYPSISFKQNDTLKTLNVTGFGSSPIWYTYKVEGGKITMGMSGISTIVPAMDYKFSNNNTCTLTYKYSNMTFPITLTRKSETTTNQTSTAIEWKNINITVSSYGTSSVVHWNWINLTRSSVHYSGTHAPSEWGNVTIGDVIQIGVYNQSVSVTIKWIPTDSTIQYYYFYQYPTYT